MKLLLNNFIAVFFARGLTKAYKLYRACPTAITACNLTKAQWRAGYRDTAYVSATNTLRAYPREPLAKATYEDVRRRYAKALLSKAIHTLNDDSRIENIVRVADLFRTLNFSEKSLAVLNRFRQRYPESWALEFAAGQAHFTRYRTEHHTEDLNSAVAHLRQACSLSPENYKVLFFLSLVCAHAGFLNEALDVCNNIPLRLPADPKALSLHSQISKAISCRVHAKEAIERQDTELSGSADCHQDAALPISALSASITEQIIALEDVLGFFIFDQHGRTITSKVVENKHFTLDSGEQASWKIVSSSRFGAAQIGVGELRSCVLCGTDWDIVIKAVQQLNVVVFVDGHNGQEVLDAIDHTSIPKAL